MFSSFTPARACARANFRKCRNLSYKIIVCFMCFFPSFSFLLARVFFLLLLLLFHFVFLLYFMDYLRMALECLLKRRVKKIETTCLCALLRKDERYVSEYVCSSSLCQCILLSTITTNQC